MIVLNLKTYAVATLKEKSLELAKIAQKAFDHYHIPIILCVQATEIYPIAQTVSLPIYAQHIDPIDPGQHTGFISALAVQTAGALGVMLNHSEHRVTKEALEETVQKAHTYGLQTLICVENSQEAATIDAWGVTSIALEDPALIGGGVSIVSNELGKQQVVDFIEKKLKAKSLIGAGVKDQQDVVVGRQLGAEGVLLASGFVLAEDPERMLFQLCEGFLS